MEFSITDISKNTISFLANTEENDNIIKSLITNFITYSNNVNQNYWKFNQVSETIINNMVLAMKSIKSIVNTKLQYLSSLNKMEDFKLIDLIKLMELEHYHQNMDTSCLPTAFYTKNKSAIASCDFHKESLFEHSVLAMWYSMFKSKPDDMWISGLTGLLHDIGKVNTMCVYGKSNLGYPYHGSYGSALLSEYGSDELFRLVGGKSVWENICRTIQTHMCSYHTTNSDSWSTKRRTISQLELPKIKIISENLSWGDSFGKISELGDTDEFIKTRTEYNKIVSQEFNVKNFMESHNYKVPIFFIRGSSGSGKTNFISSKLIPYLTQYFNREMIEIISRDEIMAQTTSKIIKRNLSTSRPTGDEYKELYEKFRKLKLSKSVNDEIKKRISVTISQGRIPIIDSCILYYDGIISIIPENISKGFLIAIDCVRNVPYTLSDAEKNGMDESQLSNLYNFRTPLKWAPDGFKLTILDSIYTHNHPDNLPNYIPHLVFAYGWNELIDCGFDILIQTIEPIIQYFSTIIYDVNTDSMDITQYVNYLYKKFGLEGMKDVFGSQFYRVTDSHLEPRILRMNYLEHNRLWRPKWSRQTRGTTFWLNESDIWVPIKFHLERGTEALTGLHVQDGITATDNIDVGNHLDKEEDIIENLKSSLEHLDQDQVNLITRLVLNKEIEEGLALTFKKDGSLLGCTMYKNKSIETFMRNFIKLSGDELAILISNMCEELNIPLLVFSTQSTVIVGTQMHDYTVNALLASLVLSDDKLKELYENSDYISAFRTHGAQALIKLNDLINLIDSELGGEETDSITLSMESICANRRAVFVSSLTHTELAISYDSSSITVLGASFASETKVKYYPHYEFSKSISLACMNEPAYWIVTHTNQVNKLLNDLHQVIYGEISEDKFFEINPPNNHTSNWEKIVDYEGFVSYSMVPTSSGTLNYNKIKTGPYYDLHKLRKEKINWILKVSELPSVVKRFPMCNEIKIFYANLDKIGLIVNNILNQALIPDSIVFSSLSDKAKISFVKQPKDIQLRMLINSPTGFGQLAIQEFCKAYSFDSNKFESELKDEIRFVVKKIMMGSTGNFDLEKLRTDGIVDELFLTVRKAINSTN